MVRRTSNSPRVMTGSAIMATAALALVAVALSGSQMGVVLPRSLEATSNCSESQAARMMAAAIAAARDLLGVDTTQKALGICTEVNLTLNEVTLSVRQVDAGKPLGDSLLACRLLDLPPPTC